MKEKLSLDTEELVQIACSKSKRLNAMQKMNQILNDLNLTIRPEEVFDGSNKNVTVPYPLPR